MLPLFYGGKPSTTRIGINLHGLYWKRHGRANNNLPAEHRIDTFATNTSKPLENKPHFRWSYILTAEISYSPRLYTTESHSNPHNPVFSSPGMLSNFHLNFILGSQWIKSISALGKPQNCRVSLGLAKKKGRWVYMGGRKCKREEKGPHSSHLLPFGFVGF